MRIRLRVCLDYRVAPWPPPRRPALSLPTGDDPSVDRAVIDLSFITGAVAQVATTGILVRAIAAAARAAGSLPPWLNWLGLTAVVLSALSTLSLLFKGATPLPPPGRYLRPRGSRNGVQGGVVRADPP